MGGEISTRQDPIYSGGESHTFVGGLIIKTGYAVRTGPTQTITFATAFPNAIVSVNVTISNNAVCQQWCPAVGTVLTTAFVIGDTDAVSGYYWTAIGY